MRERWLVDGWELTDGVVRDVEYRSGLYKIPAMVGGNVAIPNRTGEVWRPKVHGPGAFTLSIWLAGDAARSEVDELYDLLLRAAVHPHRLSMYQRYCADGSVRQCAGEVVSSLAPDPIGQLGMRIGLEVSIPAGYWTAGADVTNATGVGAALPQRLPLASFVTATAPLEGLRVTVAGPITNPTVVDVTDGTDGASWTYTGTIPAGQTLTVDAGGWAMTGSGGFAPVAANLAYTGNRYLAVPAAGPTGTPTVELRGTAGGTQTRLTVTGRPAYLA